MKWTHFDDEKPPESTTLLVIFADEGCLLGFFKDQKFHSLQKHKYPHTYPEYWRIMDQPLIYKHNPLKKVWLIATIFGTLSAI